MKVKQMILYNTTYLTTGNILIFFPWDFPLFFNLM